MKKNLSFAFIGGDLRQIRAASQFAQEGCKVAVLGFDAGEHPAFHEDIRLAETIGGALENADVIVLPLPYSANGEEINAPFSANPIYLCDLIRKIGDEQILFAGKVDERLKALADLYEVHIIDYFEREELSVLNSIPTAEGALALAMQETPYTIHGSRCLVLGYGRIGKMLARLLRGLGAEVTVSARKYADFAWIRAEGYLPVTYGELNSSAERYDIIFNTVPAQILDFKLLSKTGPDCLIIDLASRPGGVDLEVARELGKNVIRALSLPGKVAPNTAGDIIKDTILNILQELGV